MVGEKSAGPEGNHRMKCQNHQRSPAEDYAPLGYAPLRLLHLANSPSDLHGLIREVTRLLQEWSGCTAVGIRLREGDDFPYFETRGFPAEFVEMENSLCVRDLNGQIARDASGNPVLECMCGNVLCGRFNPALPFFTPGGSFWTNSTTQLLASTSEADRQARTRNRCNGEGYKSVALVPLRADGATFGLLQLNDHRSDRFSTELIATLEVLAAALAEAISRRLAAARLQASNELLEAVQSSESLFITERDPKAVFAGLLQILVRITKSEYGFLDEVVYREDQPVLKRSLAISDISWDESSRKLYQKLADADFTFPNLENLAGAPAVSGEVVIANDAPHDPLSRGLPPGHPPLGSFLGIPICYAGQIVGVAGVANRPGGYDRELAEFLEPLTSACAAIIVALRAERKALESQEVLRQSRAELRAVYDSSPVMMCVLDGQRRVLYMNRRMADFIGKSEDDLLGQRACGVIGCVNALEDPRGCGYGHDCQTCSIRQALADTLETGRGHRGIERRMTLATERGPRDVVLLAATELIATDTGLNLLVSLNDFTEHRLAEESLRESERRLRELADNIPGAVYQFVRRPDRSYEFPYMSEGGVRLLGTTSHELQNPRALIHKLCPDDLESLRASVEESATALTPWRHEFRIVNEGGNQKWPRGVSTPNLLSDGSICWNGVLLDVTHAKRAEQALRESEERYRRIVVTAQEGIWAMDADHRTSFVNPRMAAMLGYEPDEMLGRPVESFMYEKDLAGHAEQMKQRHAGGSGKYEHRFRRKDGSEIRTMVSETALTDEAGRFAGSFAMFTDISDLKRAEKTLRQSEWLLSQAEEITGMGSFIWKIGSDEFTSSLGMRRLFGPADTGFPNSLTEAIDRLVHPEDRERISDEAKRVVSERVARPLEFRIVRADGEERFVHCNYELVLDSESRLDHLVGTLHDITRRRADEMRLSAMQVQLHHTSRLAVMGELAAGIAHEVNQPLCSIVNFAKACKNLTASDPADLDQIRQWLDAITTASNRAGDIVHRLLGFARREVAARESVFTRQLIDDAMLLIRHEARSHHVAVLIQSPDDDCKVHVHPVGIQQVLVNLLRNAIEATSGTDEENRTITVATTRLTNRVEISVADNGPGVPESQVQRLFEPFYTTKSLGLGLGLAISRTIVEDHDGKIVAALNPNGGLTLRFTLPAGKNPVENV
jgi:PAS domain S-box-containing protein